MRNLKRALSLALASVMLLGLMVVGTGASYTDVSSKQNQEAIEVLQKVGIMVGDDKGNFNPDQKVTRNEMAVVMANLLKLSVGDFTGTKTPFTDVPAWAAAYVTACYADGIVAGTSATTYGGKDSVNAVQAGLMIMKALGYFQYQEDFGDDWQLATIKQASSIDLYDGIDANRTQALTRNEVAQLVMNALEANVVEFTGVLGTDIKTTDGTTIKVGFQSKYDAIVRANEKGDNYAGGVAGADGLGYQQLCEKLYKTDLTKLIVAGDVFGRPASQWKYKTEIVGTYSDKADATYANKATKGALYDLVGKDTVNKLDPASSTGEYKLTVLVDGLAVGTPKVSDYFSSKSTAAAGVSGNGTSTEVYIDSKNNVTIVIINTFVAQASGDYSTKNENLKIQIPANAATPGKGTLSSYTLDNDDFAVSSYKEDDYVLYTAAHVGSNGTKYEVQTIAPATKVTGVVNSYSVEDSVTIDGTKYGYVKSIDASTDNGKGVAYSTGDKATVVLDSNGYVIYVKEAVTDSGNWVYIAETAKATGLGNNFVGDAFFTDGTNKTVTVKSIDASTTIPETKVGQWYTFATDSDGKYKLTSSATLAGSSASETAQAVITNGSVTVGGKTTPTKANAATVFVIVDKDNNVSVYTGIANAPTVTAKANKTVTAYYVNKTSGYAKFVFVDAADVADITDGTSSNSEYIYLLKSDSTNVNSAGDKYTTYKALIDGVEGKVDLADTCTQTALHTLYYNAKTNSKGFITNMSDASAKSTVAKVVLIGSAQTVTEATVKYSDGVVTFDAPSPAKDVNLVLAKNAKIFLVSQATEINTDDGAKFEVSNVSGSGLESALKDYKITAGNYYVETVNSEDNAAVSAIYLFVDTVAAGTVAP